MIAELNGAPVAAHSLQTLALYNYGHFTSFIADRGKVKGLDLHLDRLNRDSEVLHGTGLDRDKVRGLIANVAKQIDERAVLRVTVFDPDLDFGHPAAVLDPHVLITARPAPSAEPGPVNVGVARYSRDLPTIKHTSLMRTVALRRWAQGEGYDDVAFYDERQQLSEGATWNLAFVDHLGTLVVPERPRLDGVTLRLVLQEAETAGIPCQTRTVTVTDARGFAAGMITNAAIGLRPIRAFAGTPFDPDHQVLATLRSRYGQICPDGI